MMMTFLLRTLPICLLVLPGAKERVDSQTDGMTGAAQHDITLHGTGIEQASGRYDLYLCATLGHSDGK